MRRSVATILSINALAIPVADAVAASRTTTSSTTKKTVTRKLVGTEIQANRWGTVKVVVTVKITGTGPKRTVKFTDLGGNYSYHTSKSQYIMSQSLPLLRQEFLAAQSKNIQLVSGATDTSYAFEDSLQAALLKLPK